MTLLVERWPRLRAIPHVPLGTFPTPIQRATKLSAHTGAEIWIKREDRSGTPYGGNKVRKLEFLIARARAEGADTILTTGAVGSHHVLATAIYGARHGLAVHAVVMPQARTAHVDTNVRAALAAGATLHPVRRSVLMPAALAALAARLEREGRRLFVIGPGGSDASGVLGWIEGGLEIGQQMVAKECAEFDAIYVPLGSGSTAAGLALGLAAAGVVAEVVAVRVTPRHLLRKGMLATFSRAVVQRLRAMDERFPAIAPLAMRNLVIEEGFLGDGYGIATGAGREASRLAAETEGLVLEPSYTAKTLAALIADARGKRRGQRLLFLYTLSSAPLDALLSAGPSPLPPNVEALMR